MLNCAECGKEIVDESSSFCAYCGNSFDLKKSNRELLSTAAILLIISSVFALVFGAIGILNFQAAPASYAANAQYYASINVTEADFMATYLGFLFFGVTNVIAFIPGFLGGISTLFKKSYKISLITSIVVLFSSIVTFIIIQYYAYGYSDSVLFSEIPMLIFSILSIFLITKAKKEFV